VRQITPGSAGTALDNPGRAGVAGQTQPEETMKLKDPRLYQILFLGLLLATGVFLRDFTIEPAQILLTFAAGLVTQAVFIRRLQLKEVGYLSPLITSLGLSLLLRADNLWAHPLAAVIANSSKFLLRVKGKHVFNPGNIGVILALLFIPGTWISAGQWGQDLALAGWVLVLGGIVVQRARRVDVSWAFLAFYLGLVGLRVLWLGQKPAVWIHQLHSGSLLLFAFFMISDPMTIPNHHRGRVLYAALVAALAFLWQFALFRTNALLWSLFLLSPTVPLWDMLWPSKKYVWVPQGGRNNEPQENLSRTRQTGIQRARPGLGPAAAKA
jgi:Na+-transporting NADH:ubiquinone oxidoreductase subunit NqrB